MKTRVELHYLPCLEYFTALLDAEGLVLEGEEHFQKQTYRNRTCILTASGVHTLVIPIQHLSPKQPIREVRIDYSQRWAAVHWRTLTSAYGKAPFFEYYVDAFKAVYTAKETFLWDFNLSLLTICLSLLQLPLSVEISTSYQNASQAAERDIRGLIEPHAGTGAYRFYEPVAYGQHFGREFAPNLSVLDLLFNEGNFAVSLLRRSQKDPEQIGR